MTEPVAIGRARSLVSHANHLGVKPSEYALLVTVPEGFELIDWLLSQAESMNLAKAVLEFDAAQARAENNPWVVLANFNLLGLDIRRRVEDVH